MAREFEDLVQWLLRDNTMRLHSSSGRSSRHYHLRHRHPHQHHRSRINPLYANFEPRSPTRPG
jgi:hypothetical protein